MSWWKWCDKRSYPESLQILALAPGPLKLNGSVGKPRRLHWTTLPSLRLPRWHYQGDTFVYQLFLFCCHFWSNFHGQYLCAMRICDFILFATIAKAAYVPGKAFDRFITIWLENQVRLLWDTLQLCTDKCYRTSRRFPRMRISRHCLKMASSSRITLVTPTRPNLITSRAWEGIILD